MFPYKIGFIGAGNMAGAIIGGILGRKVLKPGDIAVTDTNLEKMQAYSDQGLAACCDVPALAEKCHYLVLSVKPQVVDAVLAQLKDHLSENQVMISIAAGITAEYIQKQLGFSCKTVRVMPNTPLLIGYGTSAISYTGPIREEEIQFVLDIFSAAGQVQMIGSDQMNEVIALNGSTPAYIYQFAKVFVDFAERAYGFDREVANQLFCNTLIGSAKMMLETGKSHQELIDMVSSPGGTTLKGSEALHENGFEQAIEACIQATVKRAYELGK